jgi:hypothetical protein
MWLLLLLLVFLERAMSKPTGICFAVNFSSSSSNTALLPVSAEVAHEVAAAFPLHYYHQYHHQSELVQRQQVVDVSPW